MEMGSTYVEILTSSSLFPPGPLLCASHIWHNDLHDENIFVDPAIPTEITGIIHWQSTLAASLFENAIDPGILDYDGPDIESLEQPILPENFNKLSGADKAAELRLYYSKALLVAYRRLIQKNTPLQAMISRLDRARVERSHCRASR
ncbi:hypothetical protein PV05_03357 [Exophiala xenobiotica]|uniref:Aminoglycoside phosphotransferase domain-containing protein n=1 Tax=Exophiala xenobiotica TaxID=348802 RepID=A0A0D2FFH3_9EURO|nr:uncharacterized protein PV05_03357 [Exophiala xenobiotica]KIW58864.1 hypothetical protein PV05_03357 [Exophiala xenobiotica]